MIESTLLLNRWDYLTMLCLALALRVATHIATWTVCMYTLNCRSMHGRDYISQVSTNLCHIRAHAYLNKFLHPVLSSTQLRVWPPLVNRLLALSRMHDVDVVYSKHPSFIYLVYQDRCSKRTRSKRKMCYEIILSVTKYLWNKHLSKPPNCIYCSRYNYWILIFCSKQLCIFIPFCGFRLFEVTHSKLLLYGVVR